MKQMNSNDSVIEITDILMATSNTLRRAFLKALQIVLPSNLIQNRLKIQSNGNVIVRDVNEKQFQTSLIDSPLFLLGFGKAAGEMGDEFLRKVKEYNQESVHKAIHIQKGIFSIPFGCEMQEIKYFDNISFYNGAHNNLPDKDSVETTRLILNMLDEIPIRTKPLVICFISGGGSALLTAPLEGVSLQEKLTVIQTMVKQGASITQLNAVRSALSDVKQGRLAQKILLRNARIFSIILSDIVNDPLSQIASGPTVWPIDFSMNKVNDIFQELNLVDKFPLRIQQKIFVNNQKFQSFKTDCSFLQNSIIGNNKLLHLAALEAFKNDYEIVDMGFKIQGSVSQFIDSLINQIKNIQDNALEKRFLIIGSGETTLELKGNTIGLGGRCQHMGLLLLLKYLKKNLLKSGYKLEILFSGSDGRDGPTPVAGVSFVLTENSFQNKFNIETIENYIETYNSYEFFQKFMPESLIEIGPTGTNVMDVYMILVSKL